ncbi:cysteine-rich receptor-like protein kinase 43 [Typha angustifolia]|uniref:cysteine-rich receptor-like protein kinase 43 n=1 Tax=Typha angustifolia TaxID=59011 RepID=UPI003C2EEF4E
MSNPRKILENLFKPLTRRQDREVKTEEEDLEVIAAKEQKVFRYETLVDATRNFNSNQKLGEGGFGPVYKGRLEDGREVAVKRLGIGSRQGDKEFTNEAMLLSQVQHRNVVHLYGYCVQGRDKLLVYEYVANESLDKLLFASAPDLPKLDWRRRYDVMVGVARGLLYLHQDAHTPIIHRDIKASNILLDEKWVPKIADFGMARLFPEGHTHINTRVAGTNGYMAPEYLMHGSLSTKADVYSFGVLSLELVAGRKNSSFVPPPDSDARSLLEWAWKLHKKDQTLEIMDPALESTAVPEQVALCVHIGLLCTQADPKLRPNMSRVVVLLSKKPTTLEEPTRPGVPGSRYRRRAYGSSQHSSVDSSSNAIPSSVSTSTFASASASASNASNTATTSFSPTIRSQKLPSHQEEFTSQN